MPILRWAGTSSVGAIGGGENFADATCMIRSCFMEGDPHIVTSYGLLALASARSKA